MLETISIIIPIYNVESYLKKCIDSVLEQSFSCFELILINDGSTDGSGQICQQYVEKDNRICYFEKEMKINRVRYFGDYPKYKNTIGQVLGKTKDGFLVKTKDSVIEVIDYEYDGPVRVGERFL